MADQNQTQSAEQAGTAKKIRGSWLCSDWTMFEDLSVADLASHSPWGIIGLKVCHALPSNALRGARSERSCDWVIVRQDDSMEVCESEPWVQILPVRLTHLPGPQGAVLVSPCLAWAAGPGGASAEHPVFKALQAVEWWEGGRGRWKLSPRMTPQGWGHNPGVFCPVSSLLF